MSTLGIGQLELAINRARAAQPSQGNESALSRDVGILASLYGRMIYLRQESVALEALEPRERDTLTRWLAPD